MLNQTLQQGLRNELQALGRTAFGQVFGVYPKLAVNEQRQRRKKGVLYALVERGQCEDCLHWFPLEELTSDDDERQVCKPCASIIGKW